MTTKIDQLVSSSIPRNNSASPSAGPNKASAGNSEVRAASAVDTVKLSGDAVSMQQLEQKVRAAPAEDTSRVQSIRDSIANGSFNIDAYKVADGLLDSERAYRR